MRNSRLAISILVGVAGSLPVRGESLPKEALATIKQVQLASDKKDFDSLSRLMAPEFLWSFGGDADANQAVQEWKQRPTALVQLSRVTKGSCASTRSGAVQCPPVVTSGYRAGFKQFPEGWRMVYFLAGD